MLRSVRIIVAAFAIVFMPLLYEAFAQDTIKVGVILPLTGPHTGFGDIERHSCQMALEEINAAGGINGKKLELVFGDEAGSPSVARESASKLVNADKVVMLCGGYSSDETYEVAEFAQRNSVPFLISTAAADELTQQGWEWVFRMNPPASDYVNGLETFLLEILQPKTAVILYADGRFGASSAKSFERTCELLDIKVLLKEAYPERNLDYRPLLNRVKQANPDVVYMVSLVADAPRLMSQCMELNITPKAFLGGGAGFTMPEFRLIAEKASERVMTTALWHQTLPHPGAKEYFETYLKRFGQETEYHGVEGYAVVQVIADVLKRAKSLSGRDLRQALLETDLKTAFGPVKFVDSTGMTNQNLLTTYVAQWIDGKLELIWPEEVATRKCLYPVDWKAVWKGFSSLDNRFAIDGLIRQARGPALFPDSSPSLSMQKHGNAAPENLQKFVISEQLW